MNILKSHFLFNKKKENNDALSNEMVDRYIEIAKLVKEARIKQNLTIKQLSRLSKIPEAIINSIENNNDDFRPKYPFIRSILMKLEECLVLKKNILVKLAIIERDTFKKDKKDFLISKFDLINTWHGTILYFFILVLTLFILKRYFILNVNVIEIQNIEKKSLINNPQ
jgi:cytoskeletal protein RodZ